MSCTAPAFQTAYVPTPNIRGTLDIIKGSLSVIVLSTWSVLHLSVPFPSRPNSKRQWIQRWLIKALLKFAWMLLAIAAPEILVGRAFLQRARARRSCKAIQGFAKLDKVEWTTAHSFFADMKGFEIIFSEGTTEPDKDLGTFRAIRARDKPTQQHLALLGASIAKFTLTSQPRSASHDRPCDRFQPGDLMKPLPRISPRSYRHGPHGLYHEKLRDRDIESNLVATKTHGAPTLVQSVYQCRSDADYKDESSDTGEHSQSWCDILTYHGMMTMLTAVQCFQEQAKFLGTILWAPDRQNFETVMEAERVFPYHEIQSQGKQAKGRDLYALMGSSWRVNTTQLIQLRAWGIIESLPNLSLDDLADRGSTDTFLKVITLFQIVWQLIEVIVRFVGHLPVAPLEVLALALSVCALMTYVCLWQKPQNVQTAVRIPAMRRANKDEMIKLTINGDAPDEGPLVMGPIGAMLHETSLRPDKDDEGYLIFGILVGSAFFGSLHFLSWNHAFPSSIERDLWHIASLTSLIGPWVATAVYHIAFARIQTWYRSLPRKSVLHFSSRFILFGTLVIFEHLYFMVRIFVFVECIRSVFHLQPEAFQSTWTVNIPHFG